MALMERRSPVRFALNTLAIALHEQAFRPGRSGGAWPTAALLSVALLQVSRVRMLVLTATHHDHQFTPTPATQPLF